MLANARMDTDLLLCTFGLKDMKTLSTLWASLLNRHDKHHYQVLALALLSFLYWAFGLKDMKALVDSYFSGVKIVESKISCRRQEILSSTRNLAFYYFDTREASASVAVHQSFHILQSKSSITSPYQSVCSQTNYFKINIRVFRFFKSSVFISFNPKVQK